MRCSAARNATAMRSVSNYTSRTWEVLRFQRRLQILVVVRPPPLVAHRRFRIVAHAERAADVLVVGELALLARPKIGSAHQFGDALEILL